jgi:predicted short-subunit dehydrogenase-like oxidoreductase (DUF2520 family)
MSLISQDKTFGIIGAGMVGTALARYLDQKNKLGFILSRSEERTRKLIENGISIEHIIYDLELMCKIPDYFILAVNDSSISTVAEDLAEIFGNMLFDKYLFHVSGSKTISELSPLSNFPCKVFTAHPFQTFYTSSPENFDNLYWGIEKGNTEEDEIREIITQLNGSCYFLSEKQIANKGLYHLVAVAASNFLIASVEFSKLLFEEAKLEEPKLVETIINTSVQNALKYYNDMNHFPISGPLSRADADTIAKHLDILSGEEDLQSIYRLFSLATVNLLKKRNYLDEQQFSTILNTLK